MFDALSAITQGDYEPLWSSTTPASTPGRKSFSIWPILGTKEFMSVTLERLRASGLPLTDTFWLLREFFSLAYATPERRRSRKPGCTTPTQPGTRRLVGAVGARQNGMKFLLTEHNLYVRDTVNTLLDRSLALPLTDRDWREFDVAPDQRAWMAWWIEMAHLCYPSAEVITYLYPAAISEAADLGLADREIDHRAQRHAGRRFRRCPSTTPAGPGGNHGKGGATGRGTSPTSLESSPSRAWPT